MEYDSFIVCVTFYIIFRENLTFPFPIPQRVFSSHPTHATDKSLPQNFLFLSRCTSDFFLSERHLEEVPVLRDSDEIAVHWPLTSKSHLLSQLLNSGDCYSFLLVFTGTVTLFLFACLFSQCLFLVIFSNWSFPQRIPSSPLHRVVSDINGSPGYSIL